MVTRRDCSAITKKTRYRLSPASGSTSTVNRSQAVRPSQCACRNVFQGMRRLRSGAGSIPWSCRIRFTVVRAMSPPPRPLRCGEIAFRLALVDQWMGDPFFLVVHFFDPHLDYDAPPPFRGAFSGAIDSQMSLPISSPGLRERVATMPDVDKNFITAAYDEEVAFMDEQLGRLLDELATRGVLDDTLVVFTSDHGEELFEHGGFEHGHDMWQELLHIPLVFWGPDVVPGREAGPVSLVDLAPTILDWLGMEPLPSTDGISLWPNLSSGIPIPERTLYAQHVFNGPSRSAILRWPLKVVVDAEFRPIRVIDLDADPDENSPDELTDWPTPITTLAQQFLKLTRGVNAGQKPQNEELELDEETLERLRSLGYVR